MNKYFKFSFIILFVVCTILTVALWQGLYSFIFAWVLNFMLMMGVAYIIQILKPILSSTYFNAKEWENEGKTYKWFGIHGFRKILVWIGWEKLNKASNPVKRNLDALKYLEYNTRQSEFGHLIIFFIVLAFTIVVIIYYGFQQSLWLIILNILLNVYPIGVQRYNRPRLQKAINKFKKFSVVTNN
ncbi:hypothetical protein J0871_02135 [Salegentibacter sp. BDJ18]|uniref:glycosyl-4,4'-diaponeurosporenoate acyltransferase CrtO family protein n=1 Tax=Salegentibacter sp. BDJ18 TaxID=2816376 RepID=UPI001AAE4AF7|nr:hypothetical protein [Salegentibacter sp. BDJ18]MBO2543206.1 hypothetical protein [Salegentibacter sp. BDJ18]